MPQGLKQSFTLPVSTSRLSFVGGAVLGILISPATGTETGTAVNKNVAWQGPVLGTSLNGRIVTEAQMGLYHTGGKNPLLPDPPVFLGFPKLGGVGHTIGAIDFFRYLFNPLAGGTSSS